MLEMFNVNYFLWGVTAIALFFVGYFALKPLSEKVKFRVLFGLAIFTWVLHFSRYWLDSDFHTYKMVFTDFCGFNTLMLPFLLWSRKQVALDIMYLCGAVFAFQSLFYPNNILGQEIWYFDTIRFFFAHFLLVAIPVWMIAWKMHRPSIKSLGWSFVYVLIGALYSISVGSILREMNLISNLPNYMGLWGNTDSVYRHSEILAPFFRYTVTVGGEEITKPIPYLYMIPTLIVVFVPIWVIMTYPFKIKKVTN